MDEVDTENMNPEEIYNSFKKTSADIQSLSKLGSHFDEVRKERERYIPNVGMTLRGSIPIIGCSWVGYILFYIFKESFPVESLR